MKYLTITFSCLLFFASSAFAQKALTPKQQITGFYALCKDNKGAAGLKELLSSNPGVQGANADQAAEAFGNMVAKMGTFVDFAFTKEKAVTTRTVIIRCLAHYEKQPFVNEFTFYDPGNGDWRLVHLRYDANLATMFAGALDAK